MENSGLSASYNVYRDINARTNGEIYIGVVGPVRTGKSTFIKRFMELMVIPNITDVHSKERAIDEMPQSANGKIIMTTEPKFIPKEAIKIKLPDETTFKVRLIDCVGYMVNGAMGHIEENQDRMVKTPWFDYEIPFVKAAEIGTKKVINEHSTIGIIITADGSFGDIERTAYIPAEDRTIEELKMLKKPFVVLLNSNKPYANETQATADEIEKKHNVKVIPVNCEQLKKHDITKIMEDILSVFPIEQIAFCMPKWIEMLDNSHEIKREVIQVSKDILSKIGCINDAKKCSETFNNDTEGIINKIKLSDMDMQRGIVNIEYTIDDKYYYMTLSKLTGVVIDNEYEMIDTIKKLAELKTNYEKIGNIYNEVKQSGYGVVTPQICDIKIETPEIIKHGGKYGVKIKATVPSTHMLLANISVEIAPIVGSEEQANDLIKYIEDNSADNTEGIWETNIFGKSIRQLIDEGILEKVNRMTNETRSKMQDTLQKIINESNGGVICIII